MSANNFTPKVSIVIPVYNGANFLGEAIESAIAQTYANLEIIVVNDGSTDDGETESIAKAYGEKIVYYSKKNGGVASALNYGIEKMTGQFFSWLSHDDLYVHTKVEDQVRYLLSFPQKDNIAIASNSIALYENGLKKHERIEARIFDNYFDIFLATSSKVGLNGCSLLLPRDVLQSVGGFNVRLPVTQDYDLWYRLKDICRFKLLPKSLVIYRHHDKQDSAQKVRMCLREGDLLRAGILRKLSFNRFSEFIKESPNSEKWIWQNYRVYKKRGYAKTALTLLHLMAEFYFRLEGVQYRKFLRHKDIQDLLEKNRHTYGGYININNIPNKREQLNVIKHAIDSEISATLATPNLTCETKTATGTLGQYIESARDDGTWFLLRKAIRKIIRKVSGHR